MAGSVNKVILVGNVGKDPEVRSTQGGMNIATLTLATSETWNDKASGERKEKTEWHRVSVMNDRIVDVVEKYVRKGSKIYVEWRAANPQVDRPAGRREIQHGDQHRAVQRLLGVAG